MIYRTKHSGLWSRARVAQTLYRYAYISFLFHVALIAFLYFFIWVLYQYGFYNWFAVWFRGINGADSLERPVNLPFRGESYYMQLTDITVQLLGGFCLYSLFIWEIIRGYIIAVKEYRAIEMLNDAHGDAEREQVMKRLKEERVRVPTAAEKAEFATATTAFIKGMKQQVIKDG